MNSRLKDILARQAGVKKAETERIKREESAKKAREQQSLKREVAEAASRRDIVEFVSNLPRPDLERPVGWDEYIRLSASLLDDKEARREIVWTAAVIPGRQEVRDLLPFPPHDEDPALWDFDRGATLIRFRDGTAAIADMDIWGEHFHGGGWGRQPERDLWVAMFTHSREWWRESELTPDDLSPVQAAWFQAMERGEIVPPPGWPK